MQKPCCRSCLCGCFLVCFPRACCYAQVATAELNGTVLDPSGAAVANAKVTAIATRH